MKKIINKILDLKFVILAVVLIVFLLRVNINRQEQIKSLNNDLEHSKQESISISENLKKEQEITNKQKQEIQNHKQNIETLNKEKQSLINENQSLKLKRQAKQKTQAAIVADKPIIKANISGNKQDWLAQSGIPSSDWTYVDYIVSKESGWNPNSVNPHSGACGLGQQLPCGKWAGAWNDPVAALKAMNIYVKKYGGWAGAYSFWLKNHWY